MGVVVSEGFKELREGKLNPAVPTSTTFENKRCYRFSSLPRNKHSFLL
jgi:hypothetical protein